MVADFVWKIGGEAGYGILSSGDMFTQVIKNLGFHTFSTTEYPSLIRGGHNTYIVRFSDSELTSHSHKVDVLIALDKLTLDKHKDEVVKNGIIICDTNLKINKKDVNVIKLRLEQASNKYGVLKKVMMATIAIGATSKVLGFDKKVFESFFKKRFQKKGEKVVNQNIEAFNLGFDYAKEIRKIKIPKTKNDKILINGNTAISIASIRAGCKFMSSYPMTPATSIMQTISKYQESNNIVMHQTEDEISALNVALGASYAGVRSLVATSGGGFALMNETISLAGSAEIPVVLVLASRPGPATGLPTRTEQGDLRFAIHAGHGDFPKIVLAPGDPEECFTQTLEAFNLADKYQTIVTILTDKYQAVSWWNMKEFNTNYKINRGKLVTRVSKKLADLEKYHRYKITKDGISPRTIPGIVNGINCSIGDEHDEQGYIVEESLDRIKMMDKRTNKMKSLEKELENKGINVYGNKKSNKTIIGWGSTKGVILEAIKELNCKFVQVNIMHPFPAKKLIKEVKDSKIYLVENNSNAQLGSLIKEHTNLKIHKKILKYDGRMFNPVEIINEVKN